MGGLILDLTASRWRQSGASFYLRSRRYPLQLQYPKHPHNLSCRPVPPPKQMGARSPLFAAYEDGCGSQERDYDAYRARDTKVGLRPILPRLGSSSMGEARKSRPAPTISAVSASKTISLLIRGARLRHETGVLAAPPVLSLGKARNRPPCTHQVGQMFRWLQGGSASRAFSETPRQGGHPLH